MKSIFALALAIGWVAATSAAADVNYHLTKTIPVGGDGGWDYLTVDSAAQRPADDFAALKFLPAKSQP